MVALELTNTEAEHVLAHRGRCNCHVCYQTQLAFTVTDDAPLRIDISPDHESEELRDAA